MCEMFSKMKLGVNLNANLLTEGLAADPHFKGFNPIIFIHGYGAHRNFYSNIIKEWASHGHIIFCM